MMVDSALGGGNPYIKGKVSWRWVWHVLMQWFSVPALSAHRWRCISQNAGSVLSWSTARGSASRHPTATPVSSRATQYFRRRFLLILTHCYASRLSAPARPTIIFHFCHTFCHGY